MAAFRRDFISFDDISWMGSIAYLERVATCTRQSSVSITDSEHAQGSTAVLRPIKDGISCKYSKPTHLIDYQFAIQLCGSQSDHHPQCAIEQG